ncbi:hypothetical protein D3C76_1744370 [compost metagenome]
MTLYDAPLLSRPRFSSPFQRIGTRRALVMVIATLPMVWSPSFGGVTAGVMSVATAAGVTGDMTV